MEANLSFGEYVRRRRRAGNLQLQELAAKVELSSGYLSRIENDSAVPSAEVVVKIHQAVGGDLEQMLEMANCLPREILDRLMRRVDQDATAMRRAAGAAPDPEYAAALMESLDLVVRKALAVRYGLSPQDLEGLYALVERLARLKPTERDEAFRVIEKLMRE